MLGFIQKNSATGMEPPCKRARLLAPAPATQQSPPTSEETAGVRRDDLFLGVLTSRHFSRLIFQWKICWSDRLAAQWVQFQSALAVRESGRISRGFPIPKSRQVELFVRELMATRDAGTLRLAALSTWRDGHEVRAFPMKDLQFAVRSGDPETVRVAMGFATAALPGWIWTEAMTHFPGHCGVLDVLKVYTKPSRSSYEYYRDHSKIDRVVEWATAQLEAAAALSLVDAPPRTTRARVRPPEFVPPFRVMGNAAFRVLTDRQLFLMLCQWMDGWSTHLVKRWREISARINEADGLRVLRGFTIRRERKIELFMRELMLAGDVTTLRLTTSCHWTDDANKTRRFPVKDLQFAIRSGHADTVRWAFERAREANVLASFGYDKVRWFWNEAVGHFPGHCGVLDVLFEFLPPRTDLWAFQEDKIKSLEMAQWFVDHVGADSLPSSMIVLASRNGDLPQVTYLATVPGQDLQAAASDTTGYQSDIREFLATLVESGRGEAVAP
jgi:hypothetical protein